MRYLTKLAAGIIFVMSLAGSADAQLRAIRTVDSVGLNPALPMVLQYSALPVYYKWMKELAECEGLKLPPIENFSKTRYFEVNATDFQINEERDAAFFAVTLPDTDGSADMYISLAHYLDVYIVKHEFLHIVLYYNFPDGRYTHNRSKQHPAEFFGKCGVKPN